jgi:DNA-binding winged helix-turn-helix (wHTH) protein/TolB-like protein
MPEARYRFGLYEFDAAKLELRRETLLVRLQAQPAQLLAALLARAGDVVSRDVLRSAIWGDKTFVDFENGLNFCASQLRQALQDDSAQPRYIRTIPKRGYQFIAPVQLLENAMTPRQDSAADQSAWNSRSITLALGLAGLAFLGALGLRFRPAHGVSQAPILAVARFDNETTDADLQQFADALTDEVVVDLTSRSSGAYRVIGNAAILRVPREHRDLKAIQSDLGATFLVLGQVQRNGKQMRVLAHLIRLSDQTHIWVSRTDAAFDDPLKLESQIAEKIANEFSARMAAKPDQAPSFRSPNL